jgi:hypothetical protein
MSGSDAIQREIRPLITTESSTTISRNGSCLIEVALGTVNVTLITHQRLEAALDAVAGWPLSRRSTEQIR